MSKPCVFTSRTILLGTMLAAVGACAWTDQDIEESVGEFIEGIRRERLDDTGSAACPE